MFCDARNIGYFCTSIHFMRYLYLLALGCCIFLYSCQKAKAPDVIVKEYLAAIDNFDTKAAEKLMTDSEQARQMLDNMKLYEGKMSPETKAEYRNKKRNYIFGKPIVDGNKAKILVTNKDAEFTINITFNLKKAGGEWKVDNFSADY